MAAQPSQRLNQDGNIFATAKADTTFTDGGQVKFIVPDNGTNQVGDKICFELEIYPVDSHATGNGNSVYGASQSSGDVQSAHQYALMEGTGPFHSATSTSCFTLAKRPTMSVESSNAYSATKTDNKPGFTTDVYAKNYNGKKFIFGSWSEYGVYGRVNTADGKTFVSGAAIGYRINNATGLGRNKTRPNNYDSGTNVATGITNGKTCMFMTQTFVNLVGNECKSSSTVIGSEAVTNYRDNIIDRYGTVGEGIDRIKAPKNNATNKYNLDIASANIESYRVEENNPNSIAAIYAPGNAVLSGTPQFATNTNRTIVYNVRGTLEITRNINDERNAAKGNIGDLTGVIIIANRVWIASDVTYINATIITRDVDGAEINTCRFDSGSGQRMDIGTGNEKANGDKSLIGTLNSDRCNKTLLFDGPVFTKRIILNRTAGAEVQDRSIERAEIFNLNMANYLWSFDQMTQYNQAVTTYSRELPTRY